MLKELLIPFGFSTAINGHNHRFDCGYREVKDTGFRLLHIQAPTLSKRTKSGKGNRGYVKWDPEDPGSVEFIEM